MVGKWSKNYLLNILFKKMWTVNIENWSRNKQTKKSRKLFITWVKLSIKYWKEINEHILVPMASAPNCGEHIHSWLNANKKHSYYDWCRLSTQLLHIFQRKKRRKTNGLEPYNPYAGISYIHRCLDAFKRSSSFVCNVRSSDEGLLFEVCILHAKGKIDSHVSSVEK